MTLRTEHCGDAIFIYSLELEAIDDETSAVGIASLRVVPLSDGSKWVDGRFEIKPHCPSGEFEQVKQILLRHIQ